MSTLILNIDTSTNVCSVALTAEGMIIKHYEDFEGRNHATVLSPFVKGCIDYCRDKGIMPAAVSVSIGPGSYTGLRIGLSEAKGLAYALKIPLIAIDTLAIMTTHVMFNVDNLPDDALFLPMIDARRMESYIALYDMSLQAVVEPRPMVFDDEEQCAWLTERLPEGRTIFAFGDGSDKALDILQQIALTRNCTIVHVPSVVPLAIDMMALSEKKLREGLFEDVAYVTPRYLKEFQATKPRRRL